MNIVLSPETQRLLESRMKIGSFANVDDALRTALQAAQEAENGILEDLDPGTLQAIAEGEAQFGRGEGRAWEDVRAELTARYIKK
ncbi:MAG TPA: hypothetical protein VFE47_05770 [Tepidisphaeraceae bacterium]|nr:hypothetical protein [Tepidisphaeraceae bacterium]